MLIRVVVIIFVFSSSTVYAQFFDSLSIGRPSLHATNVEINENLASIETLAVKEYHSLKFSFDSVVAVTDFQINHIRARIDSLHALSLHATGLNFKLDSISRWNDEKIRSITSMVDSIKLSVAEKIKTLRLPLALQGEAYKLTSELNKLNLSLSSSSLPLSFQKLDIGIPNATDALTGQGMPDIDIPNASNLLDSQSLPEVTNIDIPSVDMGDVGNQIKGYQSQISELPKDIDGVAMLAEQEATNISAVGDVQKELGQVDKITNMATTLQDQEKLKEQLVNEVKEQAIDHFAGQQEQLNKAMQSISKYKQKFSTIGSLNDIPKKVPNEMKGKPLIERIVPGLAFQLQKKNDDVLLDINPYLAYRFTKRFSSGVGWNQRVGYNTDKNTWSPNKSKIYGPRIFFEYKLGKGFSPRLEMEVMNTFVPPYIKINPTDPGNREWVWGLFVGMKKDYTLYKKIKGTAMVMLRPFDPHRKSPYADVVNARFGFEFPMKKNRR